MGIITTNYNELIEVAIKIGSLLLQNGAEVYRVEESMQRIIRAYGVPDGEVFTIPSCITITVCASNGQPITRILRVREHTTNLEKVSRYNALCRYLCAQTPPLSEAYTHLKNIEENTRTYHFYAQCLACGVVAAAFTIMYGGSLRDSFCAFFSGISIRLVKHVMARLHSNPFFTHILASCVAAGIALFTVWLGLGDRSDHIIIGALMNLVPGLAITNFLRDIITGDLIAGITKLLEALMYGTAIAIGAGIAISAAQLLGGLL